MYDIVCVLETAATVILGTYSLRGHNIDMRDIFCRTLLTSDQSIYVTRRTTTPYYTAIVKNRQYLRVVILLYTVFVYIFRKMFQQK